MIQASQFRGYAPELIPAEFELNSLDPQNRTLVVQCWEDSRRMVTHHLDQILLKHRDELIPA